MRLHSLLTISDRKSESHFRRHKSNRRWSYLTLTRLGVPPIQFEYEGLFPQSATNVQEFPSERHQRPTMSCSLY